MVTFVDQVTTTVELLGSEVQSCLGRWFEPGAKLDMAGASVMARPFSFILRFPIEKPGGGKTAVYVRIARHPQNIALDQAVQFTNEAAEKTQKYFDNASTIANAFVDTDFDFIRPLTHWPQFNAVATEECTSQTLRKIFNQPNIIMGQKQASQRLSTYLEQAGKWLSLYHQRVGQPVIRKLSQSAIKYGAVSELAELESYLAHKETIDWLGMQLEQMAGSVANEAMVWGQPHGDFHYANILVTANGRIAVMDANASAQSRPVYADLAKLIVDPLTITRQWLTFGLLLPKNKAVLLAKAVLYGYFGDNQPPMAIIKFYVLQAIIQKWTYIERKNQATSTLPTIVNAGLALVRRKYFSNLCQKVIAL